MLFAAAAAAVCIVAFTSVRALPDEEAAEHVQTSTKTFWPPPIGGYNRAKVAGGACGTYNCPCANVANNEYCNRVGIEVASGRRCWPSW